MQNEYIKAFSDFLKKATTPIQTVKVCQEMLEQAGFTPLSMENHWSFSAGGKYYVKAQESLLIVFTIADEMHMLDRFKIITNHLDSPCFKIKPNPELVSDGYLKLNTEVYGGPILNTWLDRPLSIAGKIAIKSEDVFKPTFKYIDFVDPVLTIPNVAIHLNNDVNNGVKLTKQNDMLPLIGRLSEDLEKDGYLLRKIANKLDINQEDILDFDLYIYLAEEATEIGLEKEFLSAPRLDNLAMVYSSIDAIIKSDSKCGVNLVACFDNEEVGSGTKQGASSDMLRMITERIFIACEKPREQFYRVLPNSYVVSADAAHATHPNQKSKNDLTNLPVLNGGVTIKVNGNRKYATDCESSAIFQQLCLNAEIKVQKYVNHSDIRGGTTLGPISETNLPIRTADVGIPMLAMHSARELIGVRDLEDMGKAFNYFLKQ